MSESKPVETKEAKEAAEREIAGEMQSQQATASSSGAQRSAGASKALGALEDSDVAQIKAVAQGKKTVADIMTPDLSDKLLAISPALQRQFAGQDKTKVREVLKQMSAADLLANLSLEEKNVRDMSTHKFWGTQPVIRFDDKPQGTVQDGVIKEIDIDKVAKQPRALMEGFEWVVMDLEDEKQLHEVHELLSLHYVEDGEKQFRLLYSASFLNWALKSPGWTKDWHIGVRATKSQKLVAFISAVPVQIRAREKCLNSSEVNFLCVHKKLRNKRLAPVMIEEITRQCYLKGVFQACYTAGVLIPTPISICRYFHRSLDWRKLYECRFAGLPPGSSEARQIARYKLPDEPTLKGLREMEKKDVPAVTDLLKRYLARFTMAPEFTEEEVEHWLLHNEAATERVVWTYVVEHPKSGKVTDFTSFYLLESAVMGNFKHKSIRAAYGFYYGTETAFGGSKEQFRTRLNDLASDALIMAKKAKFDVFNALTLLDNPLFLEQQKFMPGDGKLHYYLFNYRTAPIAGGINEKAAADPSKMGGVGLIML